MYTHMYICIYVYMIEYTRWSHDSSVSVCVCVSVFYSLLS